MGGQRILGRCAGGGAPEWAHGVLGLIRHGRLVLVAEVVVAADALDDGTPRQAHVGHPVVVHGDPRGLLQVHAGNGSLWNTVNESFRKQAYEWELPRMEDPADG